MQILQILVLKKAVEEVQETVSRVVELNVVRGTVPPRGFAASILILPSWEENPLDVEVVLCYGIFSEAEENKLDLFEIVR